MLFRSDVAARNWAQRVDLRFGVLLLFGYRDSYAEALLEKRPDLKILALDSDTFKKESDDRVRLFHRLSDLQCSIDINELKRKGLAAASIPENTIEANELYEDWLKWIKNLALAVRVDLLTGLRFAREWTRNVLTNMKWLPKSHSIVDAFGEWDQLPAAIISAGPSLDESLPWLRKNCDRLLTIAVGSTIPALFTAGISPDYIASFDGGINNWRGHFRGLRTTAPLIYDPIIHPWVLDEHQGPKIAMNCWGFDWYADLAGGRLGKVAVGPSIANSALKVALQFGANPIFLIGQDLCFKNGEFHAQNIHLSKVRVALPADRMQVKGVDQATVETSLTMYTFLKHFEDTLRRFPTQAVINTSFGAMIEGTKNQRLSEVENRLKSSLSEEKESLNRRLLDTCACPDSERLRAYFSTVLDTALQIYDRADLLDLQKAVRVPQIAPLAFLLATILNDPRIESNPVWVVKRVRESITFARPYLEHLIEAL